VTTLESPPTTRPYEIAPETFVVPWFMQAPPIGYFCMNSMVIRGAEPILVDTGSPANREEWLQSVFSLVDPEDVRWVFLSHDDRDHAGNLLPVLEACPNATLLTTWFQIGRMAEEWMTPIHRCRFVNEGDRIDLGDRILTAIRPPLFDNPTTRGLFDDRTGVYWAVDTFACPIPEPMDGVDDLDEDVFVQSAQFGSRLVSPWHQWLDADKWNAYVDTVQSLPITVAASCHAPAIRGYRLEQAWATLRSVAAAEPWQPFTQADLDVWMAHAGAGG
jgi:flavorubredoxin